MRAYLSGELPAGDFSAPALTFYRWVSHYRQAQETWNIGYLGLLPLPNTGNEKENRLLPVGCGIPLDLSEACAN